MHPQTAAWLKDLDFTDSEEVHLIIASCMRAALSSELIFTSLLQIQDTQSAQHSGHAEDIGLDSLSSCRGLSLPSLPAEVLFAVIDLFDLPALACFAQTCKDTRAACLTDAVWDRLCDGKGPRHGHHLHKYHKPRPTQSTDIGQTAPHANPTDNEPSQKHAATSAPACKQHPAVESCTQPQVRYTYLDNNLRLKYSSGLVVDPAWLSLLPKVSGQGSSWLYVKAKTLAGALCAASLRCSLHHALQLIVRLGCHQQCPEYMPCDVLCMIQRLLLCCMLVLSCLCCCRVDAEGLFIILPAHSSPCAERGAPVVAAGRGQGQPAAAAHPAQAHK